MIFLLCVLLAHAEVVDRIQYVVGDRIITTSDIAFETEFVAIDESPEAPLMDPSYAIEQRLIDYAILRAKAGDTAFFQPSAADLRDRWDHFRAAFPTPDAYRDFLKRWGLDDDRFQAFLYSRMVVERFIHRNIGLAVQQARGSSDDFISVYQTLMHELRASVVVRSP